VSIAQFTTARDRLLAAADPSSGGGSVCREIIEAVSRVAPHSAAAVMTTDPATHLPAGGVVSGFPPSACVPFWDNELLDPDVDKFVDLARGPDPVASLAETTDGELSRSPRYVKVYRQYGASDELRVAFTAGRTCLAVGAFLRCDGTTFSATELRDVRHLVRPAVAALRRAAGSLEPHPASPSPVVLLLGDDGRVLSMSEGAEQSLADLRVDGVEEGLPGTVRIAVGRVRARPGTAGLTTRMRGRSGRWLRVHVAPLAGELETVSVTIEPAGPGDLAPVLLDAYGMTSREVEVVLALCRGLAAKEIARELGLSLYTVRDHLKAAFGKARVNSRGELVAALFTNHLLNALHEAVTQA
jgi:DNA-binding CsgD family transcriptional regulator